MKVLDLLKAPGFGRKKPIAGKALITAPGSVTNLDSFRSQGLHVIEGDREESLHALRNFLQELVVV
jgi:hypothetical protein